jgi:hypothetical protein
MRRSGDSWHDVAQVCLNGHGVNDSTNASPEFSRPYCEQCGAQTITNCPSCNTPIPGEYHVPGVVAIGFRYHAPAFCGQCGQPYPWTQAKLEAAREYAKDLEGLSDAEREQLTKSLDDLVVDVPMTKVSAGRFKRLALKAGGGAAETLRELLVDVMSEAAKKILFP